MTPDELSQLASRVKEWITFPNDWDSEEVKLRQLGSVLGRDALARAEIETILLPLNDESAAVLLRYLAKLGYRESEAVAVLRLARARDAVTRLHLATALVVFGNAEGFATLETLYGEAERDSRTVPRTWITEDMLRAFVATPEALDFREKLLRIKK